MVTEKNLALGGGHTVQYTEDVSLKHTMETHTILLSSVTPTHLIQADKWSHYEHNSQKDAFHITATNERGNASPLLEMTEVQILYQWDAKRGC